MNQNHNRAITIIASLFAVISITAGLRFGGNQLIDTTTETLNQGEEAVSSQSVTQTVNAQAGCPSYSQDLDGDDTCERNSETTYTVVLSASSSSGVNANCTVSPTSTSPGTPVGFDGSGSSASSTIQGYIWNFGDGQSATTTSQTTDHTYGAPGSYTGSLTVVSSDGNTGTATCPEVTVSSGPNDQPNASCSTFPNDPEAGDTITFQGGGSNDPDGAITDYDWNITTPSGGTTGSSGANPDYSINSAQEGTYDAELVVTDDGTPTKTDSTNCSITVDPVPACTAGGFDNSGSSTEPWLNITGVEDETPPEGSSIDVYFESNQTEDYCTSPETKFVGGDPEDTVYVGCSVKATYTPPTYVSDSYTVCPYNVDPNAYSDNFEMTVDSTLDESLNADDPTDSLNYTIVSSPNNGTITSGPGPLGSFTYEPDTNYYGSDSFEYRVNDGDGGSDRATANIEIYNNEPEAVIDGEDSLDYCEDRQNMLTYDGSDSNDEQSSNPTGNQDGDAPDLIKPDSWNWNDTVNEGSVVGSSQPYQKYRLEAPIDWPIDTDIELEVADDEGEAGLFTKNVDINTPNYNPTITKPIEDPKQIWITANSQNRSTKSTIEVTNINPGTDGYGPDYSFSDLELDFSKTEGIPESAFTSTSSAPTASEPGKFTYWVDPSNSSEELEPGTYTVEVAVALDPQLYDNSCLYNEEEVTVDIPLRARTTAEF